MGAGFKTARPVFVEDKMLKLPWQLMGEVIKGKDAAIDGMHERASALNDQININAIDADKGQAAQLARGYEEMVDGVSDEIWQNPLEFENHIGNLRNISRTMSNDMETGQWAALEDRYASRTASVKAAQEALKKEGFSDEYIQKKLGEEQNLAGELQYDPQTGDYNKYSSLDLTAMPNTNEWVDGVLKDAAPEGSDITYDELKGGWIITTGEQVERMPEEELARILNNSLKGDPDMMAAVKQRSELGVSGFENVTGEDGELLNPSYMATYEMQDGSTQEGLAFQDNFLGNAARAGVEKYGFLKTTNENNMKVNPYAKMNAKAQLDKAGKREDEERNRDQTVITFTENVVSPAGPDYDTFVETANESAASVNASKQEALNTYTRFMKNLNVDFDVTDTEHPAYQTIMEDGDFSILEEAGVSSYEINKLQSSHDRHLMKNSTLTGYKETYINNVKHQYNQAVQQGETADLNSWGVSNGYFRGGGNDNKILVDKNEFTDFLSTTYNNPVTREASWNWTDMPQKSIDRTKDEFESSYEMVPLNIPGHGVTTINKLVQSGAAIPDQVKVPYQKDLTAEERANVDEYNHLLANYPTDLKEQISVDSRKEALEDLSYIKKPDAVSYKVRSGEGYVNLQVDPKSLIPVAGLSNSVDGRKEVQMKFKMSIDGNPILGSVSTDHFSTESINQIKNINAGDMSIKLWLEQNINANNIEVPNSDIIVDVKSGFIRSKTGGKYEIFDQYGNVTSQARTLLLSEVAPKL